MLPLCVRNGYDEDHWNECVSDVTLVASALIDRVEPDRPEWTELASMVAGFHACHVMALLDELAGAYRRLGFTQAGVHELVMGFHVDEAVR